MDAVSSDLFHEKATSQIHVQRHTNNCLFLAFSNINRLHRLYKNQTIKSLIIKSNQYGCYTHNSLCTMLHSRILDILQISQLFRKNLITMIALFIVAVAVFIYMVYVLLKPEKF